MKKPVFDPVLQRLLDDPNHYLDEVRLDPEAFARNVLDEKRDFSAPLGAIPTLASIAIYAFKPDGSLLSERSPKGRPDGLSFGEFFGQLAPADSVPRIQLLRWGDGFTVRAVRLAIRGWREILRALRRQDFPSRQRRAGQSGSDGVRS